MARSQIEQELLDMLAAEKKRTASAPTASSIPDIPAGLFGEEPAGPRMKQAAVSPMSDDAYLNFLNPPSPGRNVAEIGLDALWGTPPAIPVQAADDGLASLWATPVPSRTATPRVDPQLESLWDSPTTAAEEHVEPELRGLWDTTGQSVAAAGDMGDLSGLFMNGDAVAQAQMTGQDLEFNPGDIQVNPARSASSGFEIEFDGDMDFNGPERTGGFSAPRYRIDRPPPPSTFNRGNVTAQDGVVVGQRGADGRFRTAAVRPAAPTRTVESRSEAMARYEARNPAPAPAPQPVRTEVTRYAPTTKYDVLRKGGLDI